MKARNWIALSALAAGVACLMRRQPAPRTYRLDLEPGPPRPEDDENSVLFIGTATTLIRFSGLTILTDPNFLHRGEEIHIGYGMHSTRLTNPSMDFEDLPPIDFVILSHMHEDHFDRLVQERLSRETPILTTPTAAMALRRRGFHRACGLRTWDQVEVSKGFASLRVTSMPGRHGPLLVSAMMPSVMGSMLEFRNLRDDLRYRIYVSGDTLAIRDLNEIPQRYPHVDLALLHLGGTRVMGVLVTMNAEQGVRAMQILHPELTIPIHYNDYDVFKEPLEAFIRAVKDAGWEDRVRYLTHGEAYSFAFAPNPVNTI